LLSLYSTQRFTGRTAVPMFSVINQITPSIL
jgi:hypothetical protein